MRFTEFLIKEAYGNMPNKLQMVDRIINLFHSDDDSILDHSLEILSKHLNIPADEIEHILMSDVSQIEHMLMTLDGGDEREGMKLYRLYSDLEHMMEI